MRGDEYKWRAVAADDELVSQLQTRDSAKLHIQHQTIEMRVDVSQELLCRRIAL